MPAFPPLPPPARQWTPADAYDSRQGASGIWAERQLFYCLLGWITGQSLGLLPIAIYGWNRLDVVEPSRHELSIASTVALILVYTFAISFATASCAVATFLIYKHFKQVARRWLVVTSVLWLTNANEALLAILLWQFW